MTRDDGLQSFWAPSFGLSGWFQWWRINDGVLSVVESNQPRRTRCFPLVSVLWWEHEAQVELPVAEPA